MEIVFRVGEAELEASVTIGGQHETVADLVEALAGGPVAAGTGMTVDGRFVAADTPLPDTGLHHGAILELAAGPVPAAPVHAVAELRVVGGTCAGLRFGLAPGEHRLGRSGDADLRLDADTVSAHHARVGVSDHGSVTLTDLGSQNGTRVDGAWVLSPTVVAHGAMIEIGAVHLTLGPARSDDAAPPGLRTRHGTAAFNRPPRVARPVPPPPLRPPAEVTKPTSRARFSVAALIAPVVMGVALAFLFSPLMLAFAAFAPIMMLGNWIEDRRRVRKETKSGSAELSAELANFRVALRQARVGAAATKRAALPDPAETLRRAAVPSTRLWERRPSHDDFLALRVGTAHQQWGPTLDDSVRAPAEVALGLLETDGWLPHVPVFLPLGAGRTLGLVGGHAVRVALLRSLICQAAAHHGPADLRIAVLTDAGRAPDWDWVKWLPHTRAWDGSGRRLLAATPEAIAQVLDDLLSTPISDVAAGPLGSGSIGDDTKRGPVTLVIVDTDGLTEGRNAPARALLGGAGRPVTGIVVAQTARRLPAVCTSIIELDGPDGVGTYAEPALGLAVPDVLVAGVGEDTARGCARALAGLEDPEEREAGAADLPGMVNLLELLELHHPSAEALTQRWAAAGPAPRPAAPVGMTEHGVLTLDFIADGPHGLMAGTTGSGKSELLRSVVASLAATVGPDHLTFVLIDYKGGSAFDECARLPHTVGLVTDLDESLGDRALRCLEAELHFRERALRAAGATDLPEYLALRSAGVEAASADLPRLLVVIDEFAAMAKELPDFIDSLVGIAQRGRSLGVHLLLATQRPSGAVNDNIRANTNLRVALRVQDRNDSTDVIDTAAASAIARGQAGRGFMRLGPGEVFAFQAALVTGVTAPLEQTRIGVTPFRFGPGQRPAPLRPGDGQVSDLVRLVDAAVKAWAQTGKPAPRRPWPEPLTTDLDIAALTDDQAAPAPHATALLGLRDEPAAQRQVAHRFDARDGNLLVYGVAGSGTTTTLATLALSLAATHTPAALHLYVLDFGTQTLAPLADLPHVGAVIGAAQRERQERLIRTLVEELATRRRLVAQGGADRISLDSPTRDLPTIVVLLDNFAGFTAAFEDMAGVGLRDHLTRIVADGPGLGIFVAASADRPGAVPLSVATLVGTKLVLRLADPHDYSAFGIPTRDVPKLPRGRAIEAATRLHVQIARHGRHDLASQVAAIAAAAAPCDAPGLPFAIQTLPHDIDTTGLTAHIDDQEWLLPFGIGGQHLEPVAFRLGEGDHALVAGAARSGRSTTLCVLAALAARARPELAVTAIALRRSPLRDCPAVTRGVHRAEELGAAVDAILADPAPQLICVDDADMVDDAGGAIARLLTAARPDLHMVVAGRADALRAAYGHWTKEIRRSRQGVVLRPTPDADGDLWQTLLPRHGPKQFAPGRGYFVCEGHVELVQAAQFAPADSASLSGALS